ncbi:hypothetical protein [Sphingomonas sp. R86520]|uniref:hypothetical protein n=1 Tax=Sphingomonas sp. R86520 TaxID=3093859 RepID=UPI0036D286E7
MSDETPAEGANVRAWRLQVSYHHKRAAQEDKLAESSQTETGRAAHLALSERHLHLAASAERVVAMPDAERPQSSSLQHTGWLMRESFGDAE